ASRLLFLSFQCLTLGLFGSYWMIAPVMEGKTPENLAVENSPHISAYFAFGEHQDRVFQKIKNVHLRLFYCETLKDGKWEFCDFTDKERPNIIQPSGKDDMIFFP